MSKINPRVDFAFKILFGSEENIDILLPFVNSILTLPNPITELTLLNPYNHKTHTSDKWTILDIKAKDNSNQWYNIEMQMTDQVSYSQRALYYWSKLYSQQLKKGDDFSKLTKTISIHVLNFDHFDEPDYHNVYHILNAKTYRRCFEHLELHFIELKKFNKDLSHLTTALDRWATFLNKAEQWERNFVPQELSTDPAITRAAHALDILSLDEYELELYEAKLKWLRDQAGTIEKTKLDSFAKGEAIGLEKGEAIGNAKGREKVAIWMLNKGTFSIEEIAEASGFSVNEVKQLQELVLSETQKKLHPIL
ncbi:MAG: PD-(D/E)XK nuclease family transposase [Proteobacteria bacterium]|nr:PD-(D/E)XK nuclease family transposase [Pseudomonadota bacterium]